MNSLDAPLTLFSLAEGRSPLKRTLSISNRAYSGPRNELVNVQQIHAHATAAVPRRRRHENCADRAAQELVTLPGES
jgi:hypothetical protein